MTQEEINKIAEEYSWAHDTIGINKKTFSRQYGNVKDMVRIPIAEEIKNAVLFGINYVLKTMKND